MRSLAIALILAGPPRSRRQGAGVGVGARVAVGVASARRPAARRGRRGGGRRLGRRRGRASPTPRAWRSRSASASASPRRGRSSARLPPKNVVRRSPLETESPKIASSEAVTTAAAARKATRPVAIAIFHWRAVSRRRRCSVRGGRGAVGERGLELLGRQRGERVEGLLRLGRRLDGVDDRRPAGRAAHAHGAHGLHRLLQRLGDERDDDRRHRGREHRARAPRTSARRTRRWPLRRAGDQQRRDREAAAPAALVGAHAPPR